MIIAAPGYMAIIVDSPRLVAPSRQAEPAADFSVEARADVDEIHGALVADGARSLQPPYDAFWGARYAIVVDPDGVAVRRMSPVDDAKCSSPPEL
jgi:uncharacterized glyoxalase superfamily protein PhnB